MAKYMCLAASGLLLLGTLVDGTPNFLNDSTVRAYYQWFGGPRRLRNGRYKSRFRRAPFANETAAAVNEMEGFMRRFDGVASWFSRAIRYLCPGTSTYTIPGCASSRCGAGTGATTCPTGTRMIVICPFFWNGSFSDVKVRASFIAHEAAHARYRLRSHSTSWRGRRNNPACYGSFLRTVFTNSNITTQCTALPVPAAPAPQVPAQNKGAGGP
jgi:hypothetical protein